MARTCVFRFLMVWGGLVAAFFLGLRGVPADPAGAVPTELLATVPYLVAATPAVGGGAYVSRQEPEVRALMEALEQGAAQAEAPPGEPDWRLGVWTPSGYQGVDAWSTAGLVRVHAAGSAPQPRRFPGLQQWLTALCDGPTSPALDPQPEVLRALLPEYPTIGCWAGAQWPQPSDFSGFIRAYDGVYRGKIVRFLGAGAKPGPGDGPYSVAPYALYLFQVLEPFKTGRPAPPFLLLRWQIPDPRRSPEPQVIPLPARCPPRLPRVGEEFLGGFHRMQVWEKQGDQVRERWNGQHGVASSNRGYCLIRVDQGITKPWEGEPDPAKVWPWYGSWTDPGSTVGRDFIPWYGQPWTGLLTVLRWTVSGGYDRDQPTEALPWMREQLSRIIRRPGRNQR